MIARGFIYLFKLPTEVQSYVTQGGIWKKFALM